ncbi:SOS response-associated peptidase family protein [Stenotrophomonas sp. LGBM10]|uniref:SOS response-associated peptidase family protein n=1 Tax=Stenotrophomonas sp. LGBM10 TaxID=3390038 RepID=UPI00398AC5DB
MCYSAQIRADYTKLVREYGAVMSLDEFAQLYAHDPGKPRPKTPKAMDDGFAGARTPQGQDIVAKIQQWHAEEMRALDEEIRLQSARLAAAEASLAARPSQKARNEIRIAGNRVERAQARLDDLHRTGLQPRDSRIFPGVYAPVIVSEHGQRVIKPMRYQCRLPDTPARHDTLYPGTYNARRDSLGGYWKSAFGHRHGVVVVQSFYEHVPRHALEHRALAPGESAQNVVLEFRPQPPRDLLVACLWSEWEGPEGRLLSFAAITDEPPVAVAAAGHDRCIVPIRPEHLDAWLNPDPADLAAQYRILDDREPLDLDYLEAA